MSSPNPKRPRHDISSSIQNPNSQIHLDSPNSSLVPTVSCFNHSHADSIISSLLSFPGSSSISISSSFDQVLDKALSSVSDDVSVQNRLVDRTIELTSLLLESTKRCYRKRASVHNSHSWFLPPELTIKVFSMLDTKSLMQAIACCTMFNKCAMDRLCYSNIDLTTSAKHADEGIVCTMISRAGKELRSLKIGHVVRPAGSDLTASLLSGSCLSPLSSNHGFLGSRLRCLRLYNIRPMDYKVLCHALSVCSNITDLRIVGLYNPPEQLFKSLATTCRLIENLFFETCDYHVGRNIESALTELISSCPNLSSLTLIGFALSGEMSRNLAESSHKLKYMNLSRSSTLKGRFLRDLGRSCKDGPLKTLILRNCPSLEEKEVLEFCNSLLDGDFECIQHIDVSNNLGLILNGRKTSKKPNFPLEELKEERGVTFVADFASTRSCIWDEAEEEELKLIEMMDDGDSDEGFLAAHIVDEDDSDEENYQEDDYLENDDEDFDFDLDFDFD